MLTLSPWDKAIGGAGSFQSQKLYSSSGLEARGLKGPRDPRDPWPLGPLDTNGPWIRPLGPSPVILFHNEKKSRLKNVNESQPFKRLLFILYHFICVSLLVTFPFLPYSSYPIIHLKILVIDFRKFKV